MRRLRSGTGLGFAVAGLALAILTAPVRNSDGPNPALSLTTLGGVAAAVGTAVPIDTIFSHSEVQTVIDLLHRDPSLQKLPRVGISALPGGGAYVAVSGGF